MRKLMRKFAMTSMATIGAIGLSSAQAPTENNTEPSDSNFIYKNIVWGFTNTEFSKPDITLLSVNILKHKKMAGFGVMGLLVTKPLHLGQDNKPVIGLGSLLTHWGNKDMNINFGPTAKFNGRPLIDGFKTIANLNPAGDSRVGGRIIWDLDRTLSRTMNFAAYIRYKMTKDIEATLGSNTNGDIQLGWSINIK